MSGRVRTDALREPGAQRPILISSPDACMQVQQLDPVSMSRIYIGGLGEGGSSSEVQREFSRFGPIREVWVARNPPGFAFVLYESIDDAREAVRCMDGKRVCGVRVRVEIAKGHNNNSRPSRDVRCSYCGRYGHASKECRYRTFRRSRSRSFGRSRSRSRSHSPPRRRRTPERRRSFSRSASPKGDRSPMHASRRRSPPGRNRSSPARSRSPPVRNRSPPTRSRSPGHSKSPPGRSRSPPVRSRSPLGRNRSPPGRNRSPPGRNRSPPGRSRSPAVRNRPPPGRSRSPPARRSPYSPRHGKSRSASRASQSQSRSRSRSRSLNARDLSVKE